MMVLLDKGAVLERSALFDEEKMPFHRRSD
jgi:hypothetical protein